MQCLRGGVRGGPEGPEGPESAPPFSRVKPTMRNRNRIERGGLGGGGDPNTRLDSMFISVPMMSMSTRRTLSSVSASDSRSL